MNEGTHLKGITYVGVTHERCQNKHIWIGLSWEFNLLMFF